MPVSTDDQKTLQDLDRRLRTVLPETYQDSYESLQPNPMGSAGLKYGNDGKVAWDQIWGSFCDLAMAGGPPHKGRLLEPGTEQDVTADPARHEMVVDEICRGISLVTDLPADPSPNAGWVRVHCYTGSMAGWLLRAITMENVAARVDRLALDLPAAPAFRLEREIKNVITVIAKTCHYWIGHMKRTQREAIAAQFARVSMESPLVEPFFSPDNLRRSGDQPLFDAMSAGIARNTGLRASSHQYAGWLGVECPSVAAAVWMMRALVVYNVLARREGVALFIPVNPGTDPGGERVCGALAVVHRLAAVRGVLA